MPSEVHVSHRGEDRLRRGHPWIYRSDVTRCQRGIRRSRDRGRAARIADARRSDVERSIADRAPHDGDRRTDASARTDGASVSRRPIAFRETLGIDATAYRLVHGEADRPAGADRRSLRRRARGPGAVAGDGPATRRADRSVLVDLLHPKGILARNDPKVRTLEGLEQKVEVLYGEVPETVEVREGPVTYDVDVASRPEDRPVPRSTREPRSRREVRARPPARLLQLQRRLRVVSGETGAPLFTRSMRRPTPSRASSPTPRATA